MHLTPSFCTIICIKPYSPNPQSEGIRLDQTIFTSGKINLVDLAGTCIYIVAIIFMVAIIMYCIFYLDVYLNISINYINILRYVY
jgi:hypothetical protein